MRAPICGNPQTKSKYVIHRNCEFSDGGTKDWTQRCHPKPSTAAGFLHTAKEMSSDSGGDDRFYAKGSVCRHYDGVKYNVQKVQNMTAIQIFSKRESEINAI